MIKIEFNEFPTHEIWKNVEEFDNKYQISNLGRLKRLEYEISYIRKGKKISRILKERIFTYNGTYKGYNVCSYKKKYHSIHFFVAKYFIPNPENKPCINHIDGNKKNNNVNNLEWCTHKENVQHAHNTGLKKPTWKNKFGKLHNKSKEIYRYDKNGNYIDSFSGVREAGRILNLSSSFISHCALGYEKSAGGYLWNYNKKENINND